MASRGISAKQLKSESLWWNGPKFVSMSEQVSDFPLNELLDIPEMKKNSLTLKNIINTNSRFYVFDKFSNIIKLKRVIALCLRFVNNCRSKGNRKTCNFTVEIFNEALEKLIFCAQADYFKREIEIFI